MRRDNGKFRDGTYSVTAPSIDLSNVDIIIIPAVIVFIVIFFNRNQQILGYSKRLWDDTRKAKKAEREMFLFFR